MLFLRTIRLDESDTHVFEKPAAPGEWAVPGSFDFLDDDPAALSGKRLQAFNCGFLGIESFGWSSLVEIAEITEDEYQHVIDRLAARFVHQYGAPHIAAALPVAGEEAKYTAGLCEHEPHTLLGIEREFSDDGIVERLKVVRPPSAADHSKIKLWTIVED